MSEAITTPDKSAGAPPADSSYGQILKSSSILGGTQAAVYLISLLKTKVAAVLLGPQGVGLVGLYQSATAMIAIVAGLGLNSSGVREVAQAGRTGDAEVLARTAKVLRRLCWITGAVGWLLTVLVAWPLSVWTFGTGEQARAIIILGSTVFFGCIAGGQVALLQGMRRISDLALVNFLCVIGGSAVSIALYAWLGAEGIVPALVASALISLGFNWWFSRRISVADIPLGWAETFRYSRQLLHLGVALMWNGLLVTAVALVTRSLIVRDLGLEANGLFQAAWAISGMFSGFILSAMGADFYPRLSAVAGDNVSLNRLVNEQTEIGVLLSLPGLVGTVVFAPALIELLYSSKFSGSTPLLPWFIVGVFIQVISWPIGFILLAKSHSKSFALVETAINGVQILATFLFMAFFGLKGAAIAFAVTQAVHIAVYFSVVGARTKFVWSSAVRKLVLYGVTFLAAGIVVHSQCHGVWLFLLGGTVVAACGFISLRGVGKRLDPASRLGRQLMALPLARFFIAARPGN
jgi:PST family polysaccharide transporter